MHVKIHMYDLLTSLHHNTYALMHVYVIMHVHVVHPTSSFI